MQETAPHPFFKTFSPPPGNFRYVVNSYGGSCTSMLIKFINPTYDDSTNHMWYHLELKHSNVPPLEYPHKFKAIYIFDDPRDSLLSLYRRGLQKIHFFNIFQKEADIMPETVEEYIDQGVDLFQFHQHHINWTSCSKRNRNFPILLLNSKNLWDHLNELIDFLGLSEERINNFPKYKTRNSSWQNLDSGHRRRITAMYDSIIQDISQRPSFEII